MVLSYACDGDRSSCPVSFLDMTTLGNQRVENQDDLIFCRLPNKGLLFAALDGHGTRDVARYISQAFPSNFYRYVQKSSVKEAFSKACADAENYALNELDGGSTAVFAYIHNGIAHVANIGDSRAVFGIKKGVAFATQDHKPDRQDEYERIIQAQGIIYREKSPRGAPPGCWRINGLAPSRTIGDRCCKGEDASGATLCLPRKSIELCDQSFTFLDQWHKCIASQLIVRPEIGQVIAEPECTQIPLTNAHRWLIIATDGLWDAVSNEQALAIVQDYYDAYGCLKGVSAVLCDYAIDCGSKDNITALVIDLLGQIPGKK